MKRILIICCIAGLFSACSDFLKEYSQDLAKVESFSDLDEVLLGKGYLPWGRSEAGDYGMSTVVDAYFRPLITWRMRWLLIAGQVSAIFIRYSPVCSAGTPGSRVSDFLMRAMSA